MTTSAQVYPEKIDALFSQFSHQREPGCAVLVIKDGKPVFRKGYGVTDLRTMHAIGSETNFRLASLTKQFTAMAIMLLVHDGKLKYEDHLTDVFPDFPAYGKSITIREMLNHTSGLKDYEDLMGKLFDGAEGNTLQMKDAGVYDLLKSQTATKFPPGTHWDYSNSGYVLLGIVVEKKSGMSFGDFLRSRIFDPLDMSHTVAYERDINEVTNRAYGHTRTDGKWRETDQSSTSATLGDGGIYTSLNDLEKWDRALTRHTLLTEKEMAPALAPPKTASGGPLPMTNGGAAPLYGFGWFLDPYEGHRRYTHYGETVGFRTAIQRYPDDRLTVVVLCNRSETDAPALAESTAKLNLNAK
ncbi:MAG: beta-lactamase family protein [Acidobacteria bacterium]|nr:beta-lactamase family protein [Acidobacteriota bacterium]